MECARCGKDVSEWARVCAVCGARVSQTSEGSPPSNPERPAKDARNASSSDGAVVAVFLVFLIALGAWFASNEGFRSALSSDDMFVRTPDVAVADTNGETPEDLTTEEAEEQEERTTGGAMSEEDTSTVITPAPPQPTVPPRMTTPIPDDLVARSRPAPVIPPPRSVPSRATTAVPNDPAVVASGSRTVPTGVTRESLLGLTFRQLEQQLGTPDRTIAGLRIYDFVRGELRVTFDEGMVDGIYPLNFFPNTAARSTDRTSPRARPSRTSRMVPPGVTRESLIGLHYEQLKLRLGEPNSMDQGNAVYRFDRGKLTIDFGAGWIVNGVYPSDFFSSRTGRSADRQPPRGTERRTRNRRPEVPAGVSSVAGLFKGDVRQVLGQPTVDRGDRFRYEFARGGITVYFDTRGFVSHWTPADFFTR